MIIKIMTSGMSQVAAAEEDEGEEEHHDDNIPEDFLRTIRYLRTFERPEGLTRQRYLQFQRSATRFLVHDGILHR